MSDKIIVSPLNFHVLRSPNTDEKEAATYFKVRFPGNWSDEACKAKLIDVVIEALEIERNKLNKQLESL